MKKFPKYLISVTPLSKLVALILFILLPILAFFFGMHYQQKIYTGGSEMRIEGN